jgi:hypothetical protein
VAFCLLTRIVNGQWSYDVSSLHNGVIFLIRFESDMLLQRYTTTADFIRNLQDYVGKDMKIQEHLTRKSVISCRIFGVKFFSSI